MTAVVLAPAVPAPRLQSFHRPTRVVIILPKAYHSLGTFTSIPRAVSHNAKRYCGGGIQIKSTGAFSIRPESTLELASATSVSNTFHHAYRTVTFYGVIPGGDTFNIPQGSLSTVDPNISGPTQPGTGFSWTVDITGGTNILLVGSDDRGIGSGGTAPFTVAYSTNTTCLNRTSPSSTVGNPAGGSYPTSTGDSSSGSSRNPS